MKEKILKNLIVIVGIVALTCFAVGCASAPMPTPEPVAQSLTVQDKVTAFSLVMRLIDENDLGLVEFDWENGKIITEDIMPVALPSDRPYGSDIRANYEFTVTNDTILDVNFINMEHYYIRSGGNSETWNSFELTNKDILPLVRTHSNRLMRLRNEMLTEMATFQSNPETLTQCTDDFLGNFQYNFIILNPLTEVGRKVFIEEHLLGRTYKWSLPLIDFKENTNPKFNKKYVATFQYTKENASSEFFGRFITSDINMNIYTDDTTLATVPKDRVTDYSGSLVGINDVFKVENSAELAQIMEKLQEIEAMLSSDSKDDFNLDFFTE